MHKQIRCFSRQAFEQLTPSEQVAVISIGAAEEPRLDLRSWGPSISARFADIEFGVEMLGPQGWDAVRERGYFTPDLAMSLRRFIASDAVRECDGMIVQCADGGSRSVSVAIYAAEVLRWQVLARDRSNTNATVLNLLSNPNAMDFAIPRTKPLRWWQQPLRWSDRMNAMRARQAGH